jgi:hypothetical protein
MVVLGSYNLKRNSAVDSLQMRLAFIYRTTKSGTIDGDPNRRRYAACGMALSGKTLLAAADKPGTSQ